MRGFVVGTIVTAIAFFILTKFLPQFVSYDGDLIGLLVISVIFGVVNGLIGPIVRLLALPITDDDPRAGRIPHQRRAPAAHSLDHQPAEVRPEGRRLPADLLSIDTLVAAIVGAVVLSLVSTAVRLVIPD